jgi:hypothetical protein
MAEMILTFGSWIQLPADLMGLRPGDPKPNYWL